MPPPASGFLVVRRDDGFGDVFPLVTGQRYTAGRAPDCRIVIRDDQCSRRHAELFRDDGGAWVLRDLGSLNGSRHNGTPVKGEVPLRPRDEVQLGRTGMVFVEDLDQLPDPPTLVADPDPVPAVAQATRRLGRTKFLPTPPDAPRAARPTPAEALAVLYALALDMADAATPADLADLTVAATLRATPAAVGAVLDVIDGGNPEPLAHRTRAGRPTGTYHKVSRLVSQEVLAAGRAVLTEDVTADDRLKGRDSVADLKATSLICAPVMADGQTLGLLHLYGSAVAAPLNPDDLEVTLAAAHQLGAVWANLRKQAGLAVENRVLRDQLRVETEMVGASPALRQVEHQVGRVAGTKATVLIRGESGVGKELVARAIHFSSPRKGGPFVCLNCAALTETLLESELFGHEKGAFTGATERMAGKFEAANGGTIFLDEIGEMAAATQAKFLRVLEGQAFERVGGNVPIRTDVRVVAATNRPLEEAVRAGTFRKDLYFRLQVVQVDVPPLRDRPDDVPAIADHFLKRFARETGRKVRGFTPAAVRKMQGWHWPGNVRELRNAVERAVALGAGGLVDEADIWLSPLGVGTEAAADAPAYEPRSLEEVEKDHIRRTLAHTGGNKSRAAAVLGIERSTLDRKLKGYGLQAPG